MRPSQDQHEHHGEDIGALSAVPARAFLAELADPSPASRKRKRAVVGCRRNTPCALMISDGEDLYAALHES